VHYPMVSSDMLASLPSGVADTRTQIKRQYWQWFAALYMGCGKYVDRVMVNSSWTASHIRALWRHPNVSVVFPPCAVTELQQKIPASDDKPREKVLLCIAQFRPEKNHKLLIDAFARFYKQTKAHKDAKLVLVGSVRHSEDATRVYDLRLQAREVGVKNQIVFVTDAPWADVLKWLGIAWVGVNAMWNEHFGIGVVEYQAAGLVGVVHNSGGPKMDIVIETEGGKTGFHATTVEEFAAAFEEALSMPESEVREVRRRARKSAERFSEEGFESGWLREFEALLRA